MHCQFQSDKLENGPRASFKYHYLKITKNAIVVLGSNFRCLSIKCEILLQNFKGLHHKITGNIWKLQNVSIKISFHEQIYEKWTIFKTHVPRWNLIQKLLRFMCSSYIVFKKSIIVKLPSPLFFFHKPLLENYIINVLEIWRTVYA